MKNNLETFINGAFGDAETFAEEFQEHRNETLVELLETGAVTVVPEYCNSPVTLQLIAYDSNSCISFINDLLARSPHDHLVEVFVLEAIRFYSEQISKTEAVNDPNARINPAAWRSTAVGLNRRIEQFYQAKAEDKARSDV